MGKTVKVINLEQGRPTVDVAEKRLSFEISTAKREGAAVLKVIHGYGSSGVGGGIKQMVKRVLAAKQRGGLIKLFIAGEEWSIFNETSRRMLDVCAELRRDSDLQNHNAGITILLL